MSSWAGRVDELLRGEWNRTSVSLPSNVRLILTLVGFGLLYGILMGTYSGLERGHALQLLYSGIKVPMLLVVTFLVALPSFWVLNRLVGLSGDFPSVLRALISTQAVLTIVLASLSPFVVLWYCSFDDYGSAILANAAAFAIASLAAQWRLMQFYKPLIAANRRHRAMQAVWIILYAFVGIQLGWTLRPFIGDPGQPAQFMRQDPVSNAYIVVLRLIWQVSR